MILFCITFGIFVLLLAPFGVMADGWRGAVVALLVAGGISGALTADHEYKKAEWNGGICSRCGQGEYQFNGAAKSQNGRETLYYTCPNCGDLIRQ